LRTPLIGALALTLVGCSRQVPPQMTETSCASPNPFACFMAVDLPMPLDISFRGNSARPAPVRDKKAARAEITTRPRSLADTNNKSHREHAAWAIRARLTHAQHLTCRAVSSRPCTLDIPVCPAATDQRRTCVSVTPAFQQKSRPLPARCGAALIIRHTFCEVAPNRRSGARQTRSRMVGPGGLEPPTRPL
jgi:hypothetical protein